MSRFSRLSATASALALVAASFAQPASAAVCTWNGGTGSYGTGGSWSCGFAPTILDDVFIDGGAAGISVVNATGAQGALTLTISNGDTLRQASSTFTVAGGAVVNNGTIAIGVNSVFRGASVALNFTGTGIIALDDSSGFSYFLDTANLATLGAGQTVRGSGDIGVNAGIITSNGLISADVDGRVLRIDTAGGSAGLAGAGIGVGNNAGFRNTGIMQATGGGTLAIGGGRYENSGTIRALAGSTVIIGSDARIVGGTLASVGNGVIIDGGGTAYLESATLASGSNYTLTSATLNLGTSFVNNGTVTVGVNSTLRNDTPTLTISGTGTVVIDDSAGFSQFLDSAASTILGSGQVVRGSGQIGVNAAVIANQGVISADVGGRTLTIDARGGNGGLAGLGIGDGGNAAFVNTNTLQASGGGTLAIAGGRYENSGTIRALTGSTVIIASDARIVGGTLASAGNGVIVDGSGTAYLDSVTLAAGSSYGLTSAALNLGTSFVNNGTVTVGVNSTLRNDTPALTIGGTGTIVIDNSVGFSQFLDSAASTTLGSGQAVRGSGSIGVNAAVITNNAVIRADVDTRTLTIDARGGNGGLAAGTGAGSGTAGLFNTNLIEASGGGTLAIAGGRYENSQTGLMRAVAGSTLVIGSDARIVGGTLASVDDGVIVDGAGTAYLDVVTLAAGSSYGLTSASVQLGTSFVNNGTVTVGVNSTLRNDTPTLTISGNGAIVIDNSVGFAQFLDSAASTTLGSGQVVRGSGSIGVNAAVITNQGLIAANVGGRALTIDARGGNGGLAAGTGAGSGTAGLFNTSVMEASGGGTLVIDGGRYENGAAGVMRAGAGSTLVIASDARIVGGTLASVGNGVIIDGSGTAYLDSVTLAAGSSYGLTSASLNLGTSFVNNGTVTVGVNSTLRNDTPTLTISGTGTIVIDDSAGFSQFLDSAASTTLGSGQVVRGSGSIGVNAAVITNLGVISADVGGRTLTIDARGGSGGLAGTGVGTGSNSALLNSGTIQATGGGALALAGGRYENTAGGGLAVGTTGTLTMLSDANLVNLAAGGVLDRGIYRSAGGTLNIRGAGAAIAVIGTSAAGTDTVVTLSGPTSTITAQGIAGAAPTAIDATLRQVDSSGRLEVLNGRNLTIVAGNNGGTLTNNGIVRLGGGTLAAVSILNNDATPNSEIFGFGTIAAPIFNSGTVRSAGGTLALSSVNGSGTLRSDAGSTLAIGNASTTGLLINNGTLALTGNVEVATDYTNAAFGAGNAFSGRANVTGSGLILAASATQTLSGAGLSGNVLDVGNVRVGGTGTAALTITNNGTSTTLRGAVQNGSAPGVTVSGGDFVVGPNGGSATATIGFTGAAAGSLAGQTINVVNNFDNVADVALNLQGAAFNVAVGSVTPNPVNLGNVRVGSTASGMVTIANTAPAGAFSEGLRVTGTTFTGGTGVSGVTGGIIAAGSSDAATVSISTATAGARSGVVSFAFATNGTGTSGLAEAAIAGADVTVNASVFALANPFVSSPVQFGNVQQGTIQTRTITVENRQLDGVLAAFQEGLNAGIGLISGDVLSAAGNIVNLAAGGIDTTTLTVRLNTGTAGSKNGTVEILLQSNGTGTSGLGNLDLPSQNVIVLGQVETEAAVFRLAEATLAPTSVAFGSRRVGDAAPSQVLTITNSAAADGFSESLDASGGATTGRATVAGGPIGLLAAGASSTAIAVGVDTSVAGANGTVTINFASNGAGTSGFGVTPLASQVVTLGGAVYQAAVAGAQPAAITLAARRVGDAAASANLTIANTAPGTGGFTEALSATASATGGFTTNGNGPVTTAPLGAGQTQAIAVSRGTATAGAFTGNVGIANTSLAAAGSGLDDLALAGQLVAVSANVYAAAVAAVDASTVDFGVVRQGSVSPVVSLGITNAATGALTDNLVTSLGATPAGVTGSAPGVLAAGATGNASFSLATATAGLVSGDATFGFVSSNAEMADLALASQTIGFTGTVTELAVASLFKAGGAGSFGGSGNAYTLDFGTFAAGTGSVAADIGVLNDIAASAFAETLGGTFLLGDGAGYSFGGGAFAGLAGGSSDTGNLLSFNFTGLSAGLYSTTLTFNGFSRFDGLADQALGPVALTVTTRIGELGMVPEPGIWAQLIVGFGAIGSFVRRRRALAKGTVTC